jgi:hypothetical protein
MRPANTSVITPQGKAKSTTAQNSTTSDHHLKIYSSPFLTEEFKPSTENLKLSPDLELLRPLILSQHEVFTEPIVRY